MVEGILVLWCFQLRLDMFVSISMEGTFRVESVIVLRAELCWVENRMRVPSLSVPKGSILLISTCLVLQRIQLHFLIGLSEGWIE